LPEKPAKLVKISLRKQNGPKISSKKDLPCCEKLPQKKTMCNCPTAFGDWSNFDET